MKSITELSLSLLQPHNACMFAQPCLTSCDPMDCIALCPWNSPGKNSRVVSHSLLQGIFLIQVLNLALLHYRQILYHLGHKRSSKNTGVGSHSLLQGTFLTQGSKLGLLYYRQILYCLNHQGNPSIIYIYYIYILYIYIIYIYN